MALTAAVLTAFFVGLGWGGLSLGRTMAFITLAAAELPVAYTIRSERYPLLKLGVFTNRYMQYAVAASLVLLLSTVYVPFLQPVFNTRPLGLREWAVMLPLLLVPAAAAELTKAVLRLRDRRRTASVLSL